MRDDVLHEELSKDALRHIELHAPSMLSEWALLEEAWIYIFQDEVGEAWLVQLRVNTTNASQVIRETKRIPADENVTTWLGKKFPNGSWNRDSTSRVIFGGTWG